MAVKASYARAVARVSWPITEGDAAPTAAKRGPISQALYGRMMEYPKHQLFRRLQALDRPCRGILQVGANSGQELQHFRQFGVSRGVMIEPLDEAFKALCENIGEDERFIPIQAVCSAQDGEQVDFYVASNPEASSMLAPKRVLSAHPQVTFAERVGLVSTTVDAIVSKLEQSRPDIRAEDFDVLLLDTQGAELKVMMGAVRMLQHVQNVWTEVSYDLYENGADLEDQQAFLRPFGFRLSYVRLNIHGWGDALFVKPRPKA